MDFAYLYRPYQITPEFKKKEVCDRRKYSAYAIFLRGLSSAKKL